MKIPKILDNYLNDRKYSMIYKEGKLDIINYTEIVSFSSTLISIRYKDNVYHIEGSELVISRMMDNEILITGNIASVCFM